MPVNSASCRPRGFIGFSCSSDDARMGAFALTIELGGQERISMSPEDEDRLRRLALNDEVLIESILSVGHEAIATSGLDQKSHALVRLSSLLVLGGAPVTHYWAVENTLQCGSVGSRSRRRTLFAVAPTRA